MEVKELIEKVEKAGGGLLDETVFRAYALEALIVNKAGPAAQVEALLRLPGWDCEAILKEMELIDTFCGHKVEVRNSDPQTSENVLYKVFVNDVCVASGTKRKCAAYASVLRWKPGTAMAALKNADRGIGREMKL